jgi:Na+/melibiose symporter-like transporter
MVDRRSRGFISGRGKIQMSLTSAQKKSLGGSAAAGAALAILFGILAGTSSGGGNQTAYIGACVVCGLIAVVCIIVIAVKS